MVMHYDKEQRKETPELQPATTRRIEIPIKPYDAYLMRDIADILRGLAQNLDFWARMTDRDDHEKDVMSRSYIDRVNREIRDRSEIRGYYWRAGRPKNSELWKTGRNSGDTGGIEGTDDPLRLVK